jgi:hypothetical protein
MNMRLRLGAVRGPECDHRCLLETVVAKGNVCFRAGPKSVPSSALLERHCAAPCCGRAHSLRPYRRPTHA